MRTERVAVGALTLGYRRAGSVTVHGARSANRSMSERAKSRFPLGRRSTTLNKSAPPTFGAWALIHHHRPNIQQLMNEINRFPIRRYLHDHLFIAVP